MKQGQFVLADGELRSIQSINGDTITVIDIELDADDYHVSEIQELDSSQLLTHVLDNLKYETEQQALMRVGSWQWYEQQELIGKWYHLYSSLIFKQYTD